MSWNLFTRKSQLNSDPVAVRDTTTRNIANGLLGTFIATIVVLLIINYLNFGYNEIRYENTVGKAVPDTVLAADIEMRKAWFDVLKSSLLLLGTALTTIIGYYFGQREGAVKAAEAKREEIQTQQKADATLEKVVNDTADFARQGAIEAGSSPSAANNQPTYKDRDAEGGAASIEVPQ